MALTIAVGFVVDDAIVMVEVIWRRIEHGETAVRRRRWPGAGEIGFTILTISISLIAVFTPLMFMGGVVGRLMREFALTLSAAVLVSIAMSLTLTPMLCGPVPAAARSRRPTRSCRRWSAASTGWRAATPAALDVVLRHKRLTLAVFLATMALAVVLYVTVPTGFFPQQDTGFIQGVVLTSQDASFAKTVGQDRSRSPTIICAGPGRRPGSAFFVGSGGSNQANINISLKPKDEGRKATADQIITRCGRSWARLVGVHALLQAAQDINVGGRAGPGAVPVHPVATPTWTSSTPGRRGCWPRCRSCRSWRTSAPTSSRRRGGQPDHRPRRRRAASASRRPTSTRRSTTQIGQRQVAQYFTQLNSYHVMMEAPPDLQATPDAVQHGLPALAADRQDGAAVAVREGRPQRHRSLTISHQGQFPAATISFNLAPGVSLGEATAGGRSRRATSWARPRTLTGSFQGTAQAFQQSLAERADPDRRGAAGRLHHPGHALRELHPPADHPLDAAVGRAWARCWRCWLAGQDLNVIGIIAIILLIGIVKKNGIMIVDVALRLEREHGMSARGAVREASHQRLRPILMTTACAMLGGMPMILAHGTGSEFRQPLGWAIVGGLIVSQVLTLFTTPVIYIYLDRIRRRVEPGMREERERTAAGAGAVDLSTYPHSPTPAAASSAAGPSRRFRPSRRTG